MPRVRLPPCESTTPAAPLHHHSSAAAAATLTTRARGARARRSSRRVPAARHLSRRCRLIIYFLHSLLTALTTDLRLTCCLPVTWNLLAQVHGEAAAPCSRGVKLHIAEHLKSENLSGSNTYVLRKGARESSVGCSRRRRKTDNRVKPYSLQAVELSRAISPLSVLRGALRPSCVLPRQA